MEATTRKGIKHLVGTNQISNKELVKFLLSIPERKLTNLNSSISEKLDGFGFRFGYDSRFFVESSRSGPVYESGTFNSYTEKKFGKKNEISAAYESLFETLGKNDKIQEILKKHKGEKLVCECLYTSLGTYENGRIKFVKTWYDENKLGKYATFGYIKVVDCDGKAIESELFKELQQISDDDIKFIDSGIKEYNVCLACEIRQFDEVLKIAGGCQNILSMLNSKKRTGWAEMDPLLNSIRSAVEWKLKETFKTGILGDVEGFVVKKDETVFKII